MTTQDNSHSSIFLHPTQVNDTLCHEFDCCLTVPLMASAGESLNLLLSRNLIEGSAPLLRRTPDCLSSHGLTLPQSGQTTLADTNFLASTLYCTSSPSAFLKNGNQYQTFQPGLYGRTTNSSTKNSSIYGCTKPANGTHDNNRSPGNGRSFGTGQTSLRKIENGFHHRPSDSVDLQSDNTVCFNKIKNINGNISNGNTILPLTPQLTRHSKQSNRNGMNLNVEPNCPINVKPPDERSFPSATNGTKSLITKGINSLNPGANLCFSQGNVDSLAPNPMQQSNVTNNPKATTAGIKYGKGVVEVHSPPLKQIKDIDGSQAVQNLSPSTLMTL